MNRPGNIKQKELVWLEIRADGSLHGSEKSGQSDSAMEMFSGNEQLTTKNEDDVEQTEIKVSNDKIR